MFSALLASLAVVVGASLVSAAIGLADAGKDTPERPVRVEKDKASKDRPVREKAPKGAAAGGKDEADKERTSAAADPDHPLDGPPGLLKEPGDPAAPGLPTPPALGRTIGFKPVAGEGTVKIKLRGSDSWTTLTTGQTVPMGSTVDATEGLVEVVAEVDGATGLRQNAVVYGAEFKVAQLIPAGELTPVVDLVLKGGDFDSCERRVARAAGRGRAGIVRGLWASGKGRFRTRGKHSAATVRGTRWATVDRCTSTTTKVFEGVVEVTDLELDEVVTVRAGGRHIARNRGS